MIILGANKAQFGNMEFDAQRIKGVENENAKLKKLLAEQMLGKAILRDIASKKVTSDDKRSAVVQA